MLQSWNTLVNYKKKKLPGDIYFFRKMLRMKLRVQREGVAVKAEIQ